MEHRAGVYEQIIDANPTNQESKLVADPLVQDIIVENDDGALSMHCGSSDGTVTVSPNTNIINNAEITKQEQIRENDENLPFHNSRQKEVYL